VDTTHAYHAKVISTIADLMRTMVNVLNLSQNSRTVSSANRSLSSSFLSPAQKVKTPIKKSIWLSQFAIRPIRMKSTSPSKVCDDDFTLPRRTYRSGHEQPRPRNRLIRRMRKSSPLITRLPHRGALIRQTAVRGPLIADLRLCGPLIGALRRPGLLMREVRLRLSLAGGSRIRGRFGWGGGARDRPPDAHVGTGCVA
jgi:hypothetical protein